jgi:hypothetical protein
MDIGPARHFVRGRIDLALSEIMFESVPCPIIKRPRPRLLNFRLSRVRAEFKLIRAGIVQ